MTKRRKGKSALLFENTCSHNMVQTNLLEVILISEDKTYKREMPPFNKVLADSFRNYKDRRLKTLTLSYALINNFNTKHQVKLS